MSKLFRAFVILAVSFIVSCVVVLIYEYNTGIIDSSEDNEKEEIVVVNEKENVNEEKEQKNPFGNKDNVDSLTEDKIQNYIHKMTHQKIIAEEKWGYYEITEERIEWLLKGVKLADDLENRDVYNRILTKWEIGDFSEVDKDHNTIWEMQGGTVGKATGIMTKEQEVEYVNKTKESK